MPGHMGSFSLHGHLGDMYEVETASAVPANAYVLEDGVTPYMAEDGVTFYVTE